MRIINSEAAHLSNWEVYQHLKQLKNSNSELVRLSNQISSYLEKDNSSSITNLDAETVNQFLLELGNFELTSFEKLQILNLMPITEVDMDVIVEDCVHRFGDAEIKKILQLVQVYLKPQHPQPEEPEEDEVQDENVGYVDLGL